MENVLNLIMTALCFSLPLGIIVASAILGMRARKKFANELQKRLDEGYYSNWTKSPLVNRFRIIAAIQIFNLLGILVVLIIWLSRPFEQMRIMLAIIFVVLFLISVVLGLIMRKLLLGK